MELRRVLINDLPGRALEGVPMFERFANSFALARSSWQVLRLDKQLLLFPVLSGLGCLLVLGSFAIPFLAHPQWLDFLNHQAQGVQHTPSWVYVVAFAYYFCSYFVVIFFNAALISCALVRFNGGTPTLADGLQAASSRLPQILAWALVSATVGMLLKVIENAHEKAGQFVSALIGTAWTVITFFVVPVLVVEKVGPFDAIQRSMAILKRTWGEALIGNMGIGFFVFLLALPWLALGIIGGMVCASVSGVLGGAILVLAVAYFLIWSAIGPALHGIFLGALYQYAANGEVPDGFDPDVMKQAFRRKL
jgi:hypothetical protein